MGIKIILLIIFFAVMAAVGIYSRRHVTSVDGFVLGGRSVGPWLTAFAYGTSYFSAVVFVGYAGQFGWKYGIASTWIGIGNALIGSLLAWVVLGRRTKVMTQHLGSRTMPDFFGERYKSKSLKITASVIVFVFLIPYTASVYNGLSRLFAMAFNIPYTWCVVTMAAFTALYVILGGYMATAINDFIQGIIMLIGIVAVIALDPPTFIAQLVGISWGALAGAFLAPFLYGLYWKGVTRAGVWAGFITGVGLTVANMFFGFIKSPINAGAMAMIAGLLIVPFISLITPKLKKSEIEDVFICYDEKVTITKKHSLED